VLFVGAMKPEDKGLLEKAAVSIGSVAGTVAASVGIGRPAAATTPHSHTGKLQKKAKSRLPRKQKKALGKAAAAKTRG
jgi:predicted ribonuclease toxin of YeeF-YezG toxin-antitoxin module